MKHFSIILWGYETLKENFMQYQIILLKDGGARIFFYVQNGVRICFKYVKKLSSTLVSRIKNACSLRSSFHLGALEVVNIEIGHPIFCRQKRTRHPMFCRQKRTRHPMFCRQKGLLCTVFLGNQGFSYWPVSNSTRFKFSFSVSLFWTLSGDFSHLTG